MGYAVYEDRVASNYGVERWAGYGVPAVCDMPDCAVEIDRGMGYRCETVTEYAYYRDNVAVSAYQDWDEEVEEEVEGCGLHFCDEHSEHHVHEQAQPKPDTDEWVRHMLTDESWEAWRDENPEKVKVLMSRSPVMIESPEEAWREWLLNNVDPESVESFDLMIYKVREDERKRCAEVALKSTEFTSAVMSDGFRSIFAHGVPMNKWISQKILEMEDEEW